jgi:hypothetical protein
MTNYINSRSRRGVPLRPAEEIPIVDGRAGAGRGPDGMTSYISRNTRGVPPAEEVPIVDGQPVAPAGEFTRRAKATRLNICQGRKTTSVPSTQTTLPIPHSFSSPGGTPIPHGIGAEIQDNIEMAMRNDR